MELAAFARFLQFAAASGLVGGGLYGQPILARVSGLILLPAALLSLAAQAATMTDVSLAELNMPAITLVLMKTQWGHAMGVRLVLILAMLVACFLWKSRVVAALGTFILASFAWTGHGAAGSAAQLIADVMHLLAAGVWVGALIAFLILAARGDREALAPALAGFAGVGSIVVATLVSTGLINAWVLIGIDHAGEILATGYGQLLAIKLGLFVAMLGLAALNRFRLTPSLTHGTDALPALRLSLICETSLGLGVLALVAALGLMMPISAM